MSRVPIIKDLNDTRLANTYGGWIYCEHCGENIGYLCYVTYDSFKFEYNCKCGGHGSMHIAFKDVKSAKISENQLISIKNRLCCPEDESPLFTVLEKKLDSYSFEVVCNKCNSKYTKY